MWADSQAALVDLDLPNRTRILDVGCGTGELSRVVANESLASVVGVDADRNLLKVATDHVPVVAGDAVRLPVVDNGADLVVCQALLSNLPEPGAALREFARVSSDLVGAIEPTNAEVSVESTVEREEKLDARVRETYLRGVDTDVSLGDRMGDLFDAAEIEPISTRRYEHTKRTAPPYTELDLEAATRKCSGAGIETHEREIRRGLVGRETTYDELKTAWRDMGREVAEQMAAGTYERIERVPFDVTVGRVVDE